MNAEADNTKSVRQIVFDWLMTQTEPMRLTDVANGVNKDPSQVRKCLIDLADATQIVAEEINNKIFYYVPRSVDDDLVGSGGVNLDDPPSTKQNTQPGWKPPQHPPRLLAAAGLRPPTMQGTPTAAGVSSPTPSQPAAPPPVQPPAPDEPPAGATSGQAAAPSTAPPPPAPVQPAATRVKRKRRSTEEMQFDSMIATLQRAKQADAKVARLKILMNDARKILNEMATIIESDSEPEEYEDDPD